MGNNIFEPSGKIGQNKFITNYLILLVIYILGGMLTFFLAYKYHLGNLFIIVPLLLMKILFIFNYKKRLFDITNKIVPSIIWALVLTFDTELLTFCQFIKNTHLSVLLFVIFGIFIIFVQPAIIALIPSKKNS